jgi:hypothetical protein
MREMLEQANLALLAEIDLLIAALPDRGSIATELVSYYDRIIASCHGLRQKVNQSLQDLQKGQDDILVDILSNTQNHTREFHLHNYRLVTPLRRYRNSDLLCLKIIHWLHQVHPQTRTIPGAFCDGDIGIYPSVDYPITYFMPTSAQYGLLYLPLFFHEFGHLLYSCHKPELDQLVSQLQQEIDTLIKRRMAGPGSQRPKNAQMRKLIVQTWFAWVQELFCDAVGFRIGGLSYAYAFSMYLKMWGNDRFQLPFDRLVRSTHPITWFRIKFLAEFMKDAGYDGAAQWLVQEWQAIANALTVTEENFGFYQDEFKSPIMETVRHMLEETEPLRCNKREAEHSPQVCSPIDMLNLAWRKFYDDPRSYPQWEKEAIPIFFSVFDTRNTVMTS